MIISAPLLFGLITVFTINSFNQSRYVTKTYGNAGGTSATTMTWSTTPAAVGTSATATSTDSSIGYTSQNTQSWVSSSSTLSTQKIPAHLHLIYVSQGLGLGNSTLDDPTTPFNIDGINQTIPTNVLHRVRTWKMNHPDWNVTFWDDKLVHQIYPHLIPVLSQLTQEAWSSDVLRYYILRDYGGIYLDSDIRPLHKLDPLLSLTDGTSTTTSGGGGAFGLCEDPIHARASKVVGTNPFIQDPTIPCNSFANGIIGSIKNHPALIDIAKISWDNTIEHVQKHKKNLKIQRRQFYVTSDTLLSKVGPRVWTPIAQKYNITILRGYTFIPCEVYHVKHNLCNVSQLKLDPIVLGVHGYSTSWRKHGWSKVPV